MKYFPFARHRDQKRQRERERERETKVFREKEKKREREREKERDEPFNPEKPRGENNESAANDNRLGRNRSVAD